ncbi:hypothetical protein [Carnimonas bestiolae]|uniref:hypothetical protein n=1 Tax=Carnimonas bestiolae TaxID=3402172 RepID=UPI003F4A96B9
MSHDNTSPEVHYSLDVTYSELNMLIEQVVQRDPDTTSVDVLALAGKLAQAIIDRRQVPVTSQTRRWLVIPSDNAINGDMKVGTNDGQAFLEVGFRSEFNCWSVYRRNHDNLAECLHDADSFAAALQYCAEYWGCDFRHVGITD